MKYYLYNPLSRNGQTKEFIQQQDLTNVYDSTDAKQINDLALNLKENDTIVLIGGDGTLHYIINKFPFVLNYQLEVYEYGSGNDFAQALKDKQKAYLYNVNQEQSFINSFGIGFDALICHQVNKLTKKSKLSYLKEAYRSIKKYRPFNLSIEIDGKFKQYKNVWLCSLQNGPYFGGGLKIAKDADIRTKEIELVIAHDLSFFKVLLLLMFVKMGKIHYFKKYLDIRKTNEVLIYNNSSFLMQLDGDTSYYKRNIKITSTREIKINLTNGL